MTDNTGNAYRLSSFEYNGGRRAGYAILHDRYDDESMKGYYGDYYSNGCKLPCDHLSKEQIESMNGECVVIKKGKGVAEL